jgi:outer membrane protein
LSIALVSALAGTAFAQSNILVVDTGRVMNESEVGKHIQRQVKSIGTAMESEVKAQTTPYASKGKSLQAELKGKTMETLKSRPDLQKRIVELQRDEQKIAQEVQIKQVELQRTEQKAKLQVANKMQEIINSIAKERNADVVLEKSLVLYGAPVDITDTVLSRLNSQMRTVSVTRERIPRTTQGG